MKARLFCEPCGPDACSSVRLVFDSCAFQAEWASAYADAVLSGKRGPVFENESDFEEVCRQVQEAVRTLPEDFDPDDDREFDPEIDLKSTEAEVLARERRGQEVYRRRLERLWGGRCAVTGAEIPEVLRASHAIPWRDCTTGRERLDPYNGFLLSAALDTLFDKFLVSFADGGSILISEELSIFDLGALGVNGRMKLRFVENRHLPYLRYRRRIFERGLDERERN